MDRPRVGPFVFPDNSAFAGAPVPSLNFLCFNTGIKPRPIKPKLQLSRILPTLFEAVGLLLLTAAVVFIGNTKQLLEYYGFAPSDQYIQQSTGHAITAGLHKLDQFSLTGRVVTFLVWAFIGVLCFSVVQVLGRIYQEFHEQEQVSSNRYIHPMTFVRAAFWWQVLADFLLLSLGVVLLVAGLYSMLAFIMPIALTYTRSFLVGAKLDNLASFAVGFFMLYVWTVLLASVLKFIINRHRLTVR